MTERVKRKISAIMSADVVGYSKLMEADEETTVHTMESYRKTVTSLIEQHGGTVIDSPGDNILSEFGSVVDAVQCAVEIQHVIKAKNAVIPEARRMEFRIGINLGDVIEEDGRTYGDGVNVASRIEGLADAGGICISSGAYEQIESKLALGYEDIGEHPVKNISKPVHVYRIPMDAKGEGDVILKKPAERKWRNVSLALVGLLIIVVGFLVVPRYLPKQPVEETAKTEANPTQPIKPAVAQKPSIAVLPFENLSADPEQEYFVDGMTDEIIGRLQMNPMLSVISRNSAFFYKGKPINMKQIGRDLGVRYIVEGSVRKAGDRIRITAQLIDAETDKHLWAETYSREMKDIFSLQDDIAQKIVASISTQGVAIAEQMRSRRIPTENLSAYNYVLRGISHFRHKTKEGNAKAREMFEKAIALDPEYALAHAYMGETYFWDYHFWWSFGSEPLTKALAHGQKAMLIDDSVARTHMLMALVHVFKGQPDHAISGAEKAIDLNPNDPYAYYIMGGVLTIARKHALAIEYLEKGLQLDSRYYGFDFEAALASVYTELGQLEKALSYAKSAMDRSQGHTVEGYYRLAHAYYGLGQYGKAIPVLERAIERHPQDIIFYVWSVWCYLGLWFVEQNEDPDAPIMALAMAQKSVDIDESNPHSPFALGLTYLLQKKHNEAILACRKAIKGDPDSPWGYALLARVYNFMGKPGKAIGLAEKAVRLDLAKAGDMPWSQIALGHAFRLTDRHEEALKSLKQGAALSDENFQRYRSRIELAVTYSELGRMEEAKAEAAEILKLSPNFSVKVYGERIPYTDPAQAERDMAALRKAGLK